LLLLLFIGQYVHRTIPGLSIIFVFFWIAYSGTVVVPDMIFICFIVNRSLYDRFSLSSSLLLLLESILVWSILIAFIIITIIIDPCMINSSSSSDRYTRSIILLCFILSSHYCRSIYSIDLFFFFLFIRSIRSTLLFFSPSYRYVRLIILLFLPLHLFFHKIDKFDLVILFFFFSFFFHKINYSDLVILIFFFFIKSILWSLFHFSDSFSSPILVINSFDHYLHCCRLIFSIIFFILVRSIIRSSDSSISFNLYQTDYSIIFFFFFTIIRSIHSIFFIIIIRSSFSFHKVDKFDLVILLFIFFFLFTRSISSILLFFFVLTRHQSSWSIPSQINMFDHIIILSLHCFIRSILCSIILFLIILTFIGSIHSQRIISSSFFLETFISKRILFSFFFSTRIFFSKGFFSLFFSFFFLFRIVSSQRIAFLLLSSWIVSLNESSLYFSLLLSSWNASSHERILFSFSRLVYFTNRFSFSRIPSSHERILFSFFSFFRIVLPNGSFYLFFSFKSFSQTDLFISSFLSLESFLSSESFSFLNYSSRTNPFLSLGTFSSQRILFSSFSSESFSYQRIILISSVSLSLSFSIDCFFS